MEKKMENEMETVITSGIIGIRVSEILGYLFGVPFNKDYSIWRSILGTPVLGICGIPLSSGICVCIYICLGLRD